MMPGACRRWLTGSAAAAAETWALAKALILNAFAPQLRPDCQSLLTIAEEGTQRALAANKPLARAWGIIATALDGDVASLIRDAKLAWLPAHLLMAAIGERKLFNGTRLTAIDWRANRLVDALAKQAAATRQAPAPVLQVLKSAKAAVRHSAALLGEVTHAANNHKTEVTTVDVSRVTKVIRDAQPRAPGTFRQDVKAAESPKPVAAKAAKRCRPHEVPCPVVQQLQQPRQLEPNNHTESSSKAKMAREFAQRRRIKEDAATQRRIDEIVASSRPRNPGSSVALTAEDRLKGVLERVRARCARSAALEDGAAGS